MRTFTTFLAALPVAALLALAVIGMPHTGFDPTKPVPWSTSGEHGSSGDLPTNGPASSAPQS